MSDTVSLRAIAESDLPIFFAHQADPVAVRLAGVPGRDRDAFMAHWARVLANDAIKTRAIEWNRRVAGNVVCFERDGVLLVGYWIGREYWGRGIATRALAAFLGEVTRRPLYAEVSRLNVASTRVLEKCGFVSHGNAEDRGIVMRLD